MTKTNEKLRDALYKAAEQHSSNVALSLLLKQAADRIKEIDDYWNP